MSGEYNNSLAAQDPALTAVEAAMLVPGLTGHPTKQVALLVADEQ